MSSPLGARTSVGGSSSAVLSTVQSSNGFAERVRPKKVQPSSPSSNLASHQAVKKLMATKALRYNMRKANEIHLSVTASLLLWIVLHTVNALLMYAEGDGLWLLCVVNALLALGASFASELVLPIGRWNIIVVLGGETVTGHLVLALTHFLHYVSLAPPAAQGPRCGPSPPTLPYRLHCPY